jgi:hypothetical protein
LDMQVRRATEGNVERGNMTVADISPNLAERPELDQLKEVLVRAKACAKVLEISQDRRMASKLVAYLTLAQRLANRITVA